MATLDKHQAITWGQFVAIAYTMYSPGVSMPPPPADFPKDWKITHYIVADVDVVDIQQKQFTGYVAQSTLDPNQRCAIFCGTNSPLEWVQDFEFCLEGFTLIKNGGSTERGFTQLYESCLFIDFTTGASQDLSQYLTTLQAQASSDNAMEFVVAGASLGGALATLHSAVMMSRGINVGKVYTYGSPMVGDATFATTYDALVPNTFRIVNLPDIVPNLPGPFLGYAHVNTEFLVNTLDYPQIKRSIACYHNHNSYLVALGSTNTDLGACRASTPAKP